MVELWVNGSVAMSLVVGLGVNMGSCCIRGFYGGDVLIKYPICTYGLLEVSQTDIDITMFWVDD
jgi:hypothetical protein